VSDFSSRPRARVPAGADAILLAFALAAALVTVRAVWSARAEGASAQARLEEARRETEDARRRVDALEKATSDGVSRQAWLTAEAPAPLVIERLGELLPPDVRLESLLLIYGRALEVEMRVAARDPRAYDRLVERLLASPLVKDVVLGAENREGEVQTTVHATFVTAR
jgi:Tfp pilus assembly protein PilN